jgi:putative FmdB family regulatory protein
MPIYDFRCRECGGISEILVRNNANQNVRCPTCGSESMERLVTVPYSVRTLSPSHGSTCCGRTERCDKPPCSTHNSCHRDRKHG